MSFFFRIFAAELCILQMKTNQPLFSVLIANYNNGKYLMEAVESVRQQTYVNWEIVLVDDGSTDNSEELYSELEKDERIRIFRNEKNMGCGYTKRRCAELAKGEVCGFLDPDDVLLPNAIEDSMGNLKTHPNCVLSFSRFYTCDEKLNKIGECRKLELKGKSYFENRDYCPEHLAVFRRDAYQNTDGINPLLKAGVDQDLYFRLEEVGGVAVMDKFTYLYRQNSNALTSIPDWCYYWNTIVRHDTCMRRGLPVRDYAFADYLEQVAEERRYAKEQVTKMKNSKAYRIGKVLLKPFTWFKRFFEKTK